MRQKGAQPLAHDVEQLERLGIDARRDGAIGRDRRLARQLVQRVDGVGGRVALLALLRLSGLHRLRVDARLEQGPVGHDVFHLLLAAHARHMLALEPQLHPLRHDRLEQLVVPLDVEQHKMRLELQRLDLWIEPPLDDGTQLLKDTVRLIRVLEVDRHGRAVEGEDGVERMDGACPALRAQIELELVVEREVELRAQRVQQQIDLIHHQAARAEETHHVGERAHVELHRGRMARRGVAQHVHLLDQLELERLDGLRGAQHDAAVGRSRLELLDRGPCDLRAPIEEQRERALAHDRRERGAHDCLLLLEERGRHREHHQRLAVGEQQREQRSDHLGLTAAHQHLFDDRLAKTQRVDELVDHLDLSLAQDYVVRELKEQEARIVARARLVDILATCQQPLAERQGLEIELGCCFEAPLLVAVRGALAHESDRRHGTGPSVGPGSGGGGGGGEVGSGGRRRLQQTRKGLGVVDRPIDGADARGVHDRRDDEIEDLLALRSTQERIDHVQVVDAARGDEQAEEEIKRSFALELGDLAQCKDLAGARVCLRVEGAVRDDKVGQVEQQRERLLHIGRVALALGRERL